MRQVSVLSATALLFQGFFCSCSLGQIALGFCASLWLTTASLSSTWLGCVREGVNCFQTRGAISFPRVNTWSRLGIQAFVSRSLLWGSGARAGGWCCRLDVILPSECSDPTRLEFESPGRWLKAEPGAAAPQSPWLPLPGQFLLLRPHHSWENLCSGFGGEAWSVTGRETASGKRILTALDFWGAGVLLGWTVMGREIRCGEGSDVSQ